MVCKEESTKENSNTKKEQTGGRMKNENYEI